MGKFLALFLLACTCVFAAYNTGKNDGRAEGLAKGLTEGLNQGKMRGCEQELRAVNNILSQFGIYMQDSVKCRLDGDKVMLDFVNLDGGEMTLNVDFSPVEN